MTRQERVKRDNTFSKAIRNTHKESYEDGIKRQIQEAKAKKEANEQLVEAFKAKKLKSKKLIAKAKSLAAAQ